MKRFLMHCILTVIPAVLLTGSSCPTRDPIPPRRLGAPAIVDRTLTGYVHLGRAQEAVRLTWKTPRNDSLSINELRLLARNSGDTSFTLILQGIPDTVTSHSVPIIDLSRGASIQNISFALFAMDSLGRAGDTSAVCSIGILQSPQLLAPADTMRTRVFQWHIGGETGLMFGYYSWIMIWDSTGLVWESAKPANPDFGGEILDTTYTLSIPDSVQLAQGTAYFWGAKIQANTAEVREAIKIRSFQVP